LIRHADFRSEWVAKRNIDVWLPAGYDAKKKYAVLFMQDGQMLFDSSITWNRQEWGMDEVAGLLINQNKVRPFIIVGISNGGSARHREYLPQKPFTNLSASSQKEVLSSRRPEGSTVFDGDKIISDLYLRFVVKELMPFIQKKYPVSKKQEDNYIMGSSMGGLISLYAVCEYPRVFGGAACLSTHWPGIFSAENNPYPAALFEYLRENIPRASTHRFYFDHGTKALDAMYGSYQQEADRIFKEKGYGVRNFDSRIFEGAPHDENAWRQRMDVPLLFLLRRSN
jgi:enterochelin esterase-like enzyme